MNTNPKKDKSIVVGVIFLLSIAFLIAVSGCSNLLNGEAGKDDYGTLTISVGGGNSRNAVSIPYPPADVMDQLLHEITFTSNDGFKKDPVTLKSNASETIKLQAGTWLINVYAYLDKNNEKIPYAKSSKEVTVKIAARETTTASVQMEVLYFDLNEKLAKDCSIWVQNQSGTTAYLSLQEIVQDSNNNDVFSSGGVQTIWIFGDQTMDPSVYGPMSSTDDTALTVIVKSPNPQGVTITYGNNYSPTPNNPCPLFTIAPNTTMILDKGVTLKGINDNYSPLIKVEGGTLVMKKNSEISGNTNNGNDIGGGVHINGRSTGVSPDIELYIGEFRMEGGVISGNTASQGGGVYVGEDGKFSKTGGIIYGNDEANNLNNTADMAADGYSGNAVFVAAIYAGKSDLTRFGKRRNITASEKINLDSETDVNWED